jgi:alkyl hydroperoxide reductase subunit AhpC
MAAFGEKWYVLFFYVLNFTMVGVDVILYFRNRRLDRRLDRRRV